MAKGDNATFSIQTYGTRKVVVTQISMGLEMNVDDSITSRFARMFKTHHVTAGMFNIRLVFNSFERHESFMKWLQGYVRRASDPGFATHPVRFICPVRNIDKQLIFMGGVAFGDRVGMAAYPANLQFKEIADRTTLSEENRSTFRLPDSDDPALPYLYPAGTQLNGKALGKDYIFETDYDAAPPPIIPGRPS